MSFFTGGILHLDDIRSLTAEADPPTAGVPQLSKLLCPPGIPPMYGALTVRRARPGTGEFRGVIPPGQHCGLRRSCP